MGFEPTTTGIRIRDSTAELQPPKKLGAPDRIRTCYPRLRRPVLYPDELRAPHRGRGGGIRTPDILLPKQVRYQTALHPAGHRTHERNYTCGGGALWASGAGGGAGGASSLRAGGSSSAFLASRTRPLSSASSTLTFTICPSFR